MKKISLTTAALALSAAPAFAEGVDIKAKAGYTTENNISATYNPNGSISGTTNFSGALNGYNVGLSLLFPYSQTDAITPLIGIGALYTNAHNTQTYASGVPGIGDISATITNENLSGELNLGLKAELAFLSIYGLVNGGYSFYDSLTASATGGINVNSPSIKDHYYYGVSVGAAVALLPTFHLGVELTDNRHSMNINPSNGAGNFNATYNEFSTDLVARFDL